MDGVVCGSCGEPIQGQCIQALNRSYHPDHFCCCECGEKLVGKIYSKQDQPICEGCYTKQLSVCKSCRKPIFGQAIKALQAMWHKECLVCSTCKNPLGGRFFQKDGFPYCSDCYSNAAIRCAACEKEILDQVCKALGKAWHVSCFTCTVCNVPFAGKQVFERGGLPYCGEHLSSTLGSDRRAPPSRTKNENTPKSEKTDESAKLENPTEESPSPPPQRSVPTTASPSSPKTHTNSSNEPNKSVSIDAEEETLSPKPGRATPAVSAAETPDSKPILRKRPVPPRRGTPPQTRNEEPNVGPPTPERPPERELVRRTPPTRQNKIDFRRSCAITKSPVRNILAESPVRSNSRSGTITGVNRPPPPPRRRDKGSMPSTETSLSPKLEKSKSDPRLKQLKISGKRLDSSNTSPFRTLKRLLHLTIEAMNVDDISKARIEEIIFTSPGFQSLKHQRSISLKQEQEIKQLLSIVEAMIAQE